jgi:uncharacterized cupin superfamily protein
MHARNPDKPAALTAFASATPAPTNDRPRADRLVRGNPLRTTWQHFAAAAGDMTAGVWACEPGAWNIAFPAGKDEFFCIIDGRIRITDESGRATLFGPGDAGVIPAGFAGCFEVIEAVRKHYVVVERPRGA